MTSNYSNKIGIRELGALTMWVRSVAGKHFNVSFVKNLPAPCIDIHGNMRLPQPVSSMTVSDAIKLRGWCIHETSHPIYQPDGFEILKNNPMKEDSPLGFIFNMVMDVHCETMRAYDWPGDGKALSEYGAVLGHELTPKVTKTVSGAGGKDENYMKSLSMLYACIRAESTWNVGMAISFEDLWKSLPKDTITLGEKLLTKFKLKERLVEAPEKETSQSMFDLAKEIYQFLYDKDPEEEIQKKGKGKGKDKGEGSKGEKDEGEGDGEEGDGEGEEGEDESESDAKSGSGKDADKDGKGKLKDRPKINEMLFSDHYETLVGKGHGMGFDFTEYREQESYTPVDFGRFKFIDYKKGTR